MDYNKEQILKYISKDINVIMVKECNLYNNELSIKENIEKSTQIEENLFGFIKSKFYFGGNNEDISKELSSIASSQNNILPINEINCYEAYTEVIIGKDIYKLIKHEF